MADYVERDALQTASQQASRCLTFYNQARSSDPEVSPTLGLPDIDQLAALYFDNRLFRVDFLTVDVLTKKIQADLWQVRGTVAKRLARELREAQTRHHSLLSQNKTVHLKLRRARAHLDATRRAIMIDVASNPVQLTSEPESVLSSEEQAEEVASSSNPYAEFLASRASTLDTRTGESKIGRFQTLQ